MSKKTFGIWIWALILFMEYMPYGAVCVFSNGPCQSMRCLYSYFDPLPFGYANFGPLLTALLSVLAAICLLFYLFSKKEQGLKVVSALSCVAFVTSLLLLMFGLKYLSALGLLISLFLLVSYFWCKSIIENQ